MLAMLLAVVVHYVGGNQLVVCVSELVSDDEDFSSNSGSGESDGNYDICANENCSCSSLNHALANLHNNIVINITTDVILSSHIRKSDLHNVSIIGHNNPTVKCKTDGRIHFTFCHNCIIQGITWDRCGSKSKAGIRLNNSSNIALFNCSFQRSLGRAVILSEVSGEISISYCIFVNNNEYRHHGTAIHYSSHANATSHSHFVFNISNCRFSHNGHAKSVIYVENSIQYGNINLYDSIFHDNIGVSIFLVNQKLFLHGIVSFQNNKARDGAGIYIRDHSTVVFSKNSDVAFIQNLARYGGGAIFLTTHSSIVSDQNSNIRFHSNLAKKFGAAIYSQYNSHIIFTGKSNVTFNRNGPFNKNRLPYFYYLPLLGIIYLTINAGISFQGHATTVFSNNIAHSGGAICIYSSSISFGENSVTLFSSNSADFGGAVCSLDNGYITFEGNSTTRFNNNAAYYSGAILVEDGASVSFKANSTTVFSNNNAVKYGAALSSSHHSDIIFDDNSKIHFSSNKATNDTVVYSIGGSKIIVNGHSSVVFNNLPAKWCNNTCLPYTGQTDIATIDSNGVVRCSYQNGFICQSRKCYCNEFKTDFKNNSVTIITEAVRLSSIASFENLNNVSIIGHNNPTVYCINGSGLTITDSSNIVLEGITWVGCGNNMKKGSKSALNFYLSLNVTIKACLFQYSKGSAIVLSKVSGEVTINYCKFVNNGNYGVYIMNRISKHNDKIIICNSSFYHNQDVSIRVVNQQVYFNGKITFKNNVASDGSGIYISGHSTVIFGTNSDVAFTENIADSQGGAIFLRDNSTILFDKASKVAFNDNMATNGTIFSKTSSNVIFQATCEVTFSSNTVKEHGAAIHTNDNSHVIFKGNAKVKFNNNIVSSHNESRQLGGTIFSENNGSLSFESNSTTMFSHNTARFGAAVFLFCKSTMKFEGRSRIIFNNNTAYNGGAIALYNDCTASIKQLSNLTFTNNTASQCGGALHISRHCHLSFTDKSFTLFADNRAKNYGGAACSNLNSSINFKKRSTIIFNSNTASFGENLYSTGNSTVNLKTSNMIINNNKARWDYGSQFTNKINDIVIDADGVVSCSNHREYYVCRYSKCFCKMLQDIPSDAVVTIAENITLSSIIQLTELVNISLIGYNNSSIQCKNDGGLQFTSCSSVTIVNITWNALNSKKNIFNNVTPQIEFYDSSNITIDNCIFQRSVGRAVVLSEVSGHVDIKHCKFVNNHNIYPHRVHGTAIHYSSSCSKVSEDRLMINQCYFSDNSGIASLILLENPHNNTLCESVILENSKFNNNEGVCIYLSNQSLYIKGNVLFENNVADNGTGIFINHHSNVTLGETSNVSFVHNSAVVSGGAIYINDWSNVIFEYDAYVIFSSNKAMRSGGSIHSVDNSGIILKENSTVQFLYSNSELGGTLYVDNDSFIITKGMSKLTFDNSEAIHGGVMYITQSCNMVILENCTIEFLNCEAKRDGGCIYSDSNSSIMFSGNSITKFYKSKATQGGAIYSCNNGGILIDENSMVWFNTSSAVLGGTLYSEKNSFIMAKGKCTLSITNSEAINGGTSYITGNCDMTITENSTIAFLNNEAKAEGGSVYSDFSSSIKFKGNSIITITDNKATQGGAIYSKASSTIGCENNSTIVFNRNKATQNGGCIYTEKSDIQFKGNCRAIFNNSVVFNGAGGALFCTENSHVSFISSKVTFYKNTVYSGEGGAICCINSVALFEGESDVVFDSNKAIKGGAANLDLNSSLTIRNNSIVSFNFNLATMGGAVNFYSHSHGIFEMNSVLVLRGNKASQNGGAFHVEGKSTIEFKQFVMVEFDKNDAERGGAIFLTVSTTLYMQHPVITFKNNTASQDGGAVYLGDQSQLTFMRGSSVTFSHNMASDYGGAMYSEMVGSTINFNSTKVLFYDNNAGTTGSSVYINLPKQCNNTCLTNSILGISIRDYNKYIITSPTKVQLYSSKIKCTDFGNDAECDSYYINNIMLGQKIFLDACMYDYYNHPVDVARFLISGTTNQGYHLDSNNTLITCNRTIELVNIHGNDSAPFNYSIKFSLHDKRQSESKEVLTNLLVELLPCHLGFTYHRQSQKCECYNASGVVFCFGSRSTIKRGYWFGDIAGKSTVAFCPINYCNFTCCETSNGYYHLSPVRDNQCKPHRSGCVCGSCTHGYTLSFDSTECVDVESCTAGQTVLVILLAVIYWIVMVTLIFAVMYFKVGIGYLYSITYYYSIVDILLSQNLDASRELYLTVNIMSSFSKIIPQFLGVLCLTTGMSGIDQQFIHYVHPSAVILILIMITLLARISQRVSEIISRGIINVICLLLLLSYTSMASTSLLLMRPLTFHEIDKVYTYLSPDIEYFHGRHLAYGIIALFFSIFIVIGLPLLLTLEPLLNHKFNFVKIKPLLDQFQGCYKDKYRCFAGYYMISRLVIISIVIVNNFVANYMLVIVCGIIDLIHISVKPYSNEIINKFDGIILHLLIFIVALPLLDEFDSPLVIIIAFVLVVLPLLNFIAMALFLHKGDLQSIAKYFRVAKDETPNSSNTKNNEIPAKEFHFIVDDNVRQKANVIICDM